jgi:hypothetical protein
MVQIYQKGLPSVNFFINKKVTIGVLKSKL